MATVEVSREDIVRRQIESVGRDAKADDALYAADAVRYDPVTPQGMKGRDAIRKYQETIAKAFQDVEARTLSVVSKGDITAWEWIFTLTNGGPLELPTGNLAPTSRRVTMNGATFYRFNREGLIAEQRDYFDIAGLMQQLGVKP